MNIKRRHSFIVSVTALGLICAYFYLSRLSWPVSTEVKGQVTSHDEVAPSSDDNIVSNDSRPEAPVAEPTFLWTRRPTRYPVQSITPLPTERPRKLPKVQADFPAETDPQKAQVRQQRQKAVKDAFIRCWTAYKSRAWMADEVTPLSGTTRNWFGGLGATLVDSLDTLWMMGLHEEFEEAVSAVVQINFETTSLSQINTFETNIRYLGGLLAAYDLSHDKRLLNKAVEVGEMLYAAFDTPNRMPITRWDFQSAARGEEQVAPEGVLVAEIGSFTLEFTRLSQITGDPKWFDAIHRVMGIFYRQQDLTKLPGMWPVVVNAREEDFTQDTTYTLGAMADSVYEYLPKMHALVGGVLPMYESMYRDAMDTAIRHSLFRPMTPEGADILVAGAARIVSEAGQPNRVTLEPKGEHLICFAGGMMTLGGRLMQNDTHVDLGRKLTDGCIWTYKALPSGIMPEVFHMSPCASGASCSWDEAQWQREVLSRAKGPQTQDAAEAIREQRLPKGFTSIADRRYLLRPEAIESAFILYRITGREDLLDAGWTMFEAIQNATETDLANAALSDITVPQPPKTDSMESFWMGETLKYFFLLFSSPDLINLDEYIFNTEAHPLKRAK
ncbi:endoplasmic reticulum mannosyl-oligosaccharide 1,2-alpha-mannosidase [Aspergillus lentulus]|nr:endoplasmic reticulum mannosyl-oligosaccharide 1,2-alpha-mannosidase [Aspergillus lentulus]